MADRRELAHLVERPESIREGNRFDSGILHKVPLQRDFFSVPGMGISYKV